MSNCALIAVCIYCHVAFQYFAHSKWVLYNSAFSFCFFFSIQKFDFLVYSISDCCCSGVPVLPVISVYFDAEVFWRQLLGFAYFVKPNGCIRSLVILPWCFCSCCRFLPVEPLIILIIT